MRRVCNTDRMGRHSAPDDEEDGDLLVTAAVVIDPPRRGRHARAEDDEGESAGGPPGTPLHLVALVQPSAEPLARPGVDAGDEPTAPSARADDVDPPPRRTDPSGEIAPARVGKGNQSTAADLDLLRRHADVRARVIAAVVAPFVIYTIVMYLAGALDVYFIWVWLPLVSAGVLAGSILDAAHRKRGSAAASD